MKYLFLSSLSLLILTGCTTQKLETPEPETEVYIENNKIIYDGILTPAANEKLIELYANNQDSIKTIAIRSDGGDIGLGMDLGEFIFYNNLNVQVDDYCFSSCANYVFPSGKIKYLSSKATLGFHGSALSEDFDIDPSVEQNPEFKQEFEQYLSVMRKREADFYQTLGVNPLLTTLGQSEKYQQKYSNYQGWYYSVEALNSLGINNIYTLNPQQKIDSVATDYKLFEVPLQDVKQAI